MRVVLFFLLIILCLAGCDGNRVFEDYKDFGSKSWVVNDTVNFEFQISSPELYNLQCDIRSSLDYPYSRIFVNYTLEDSTHQILATKLVSSYLFDAKTGEPNGDSGLGDIYDHRFTLLQNRTFTPGKYFVKLQQFMRTDTLQGVLAAGIRVERAESN
jgi:gliding motility-associated lipoprotein GldH